MTITQVTGNRETPSAPARNDSLMIRAAEEYAALVRAGQKPNRELFLARYADIADALAPCLDGLDFVHAAGQELSEPGAALSDSLAALATAEPLGDFRLVREIGRGGMGIVYEAEQLSLNRRVALKILPFAATMDPRHLQRFRNEALAAASLRHENIVHVYGVGSDRGVHYYAMELIEGQTLAEVIKDLSPQPPSRSGKGEQESPPLFPLREGGPGGLGSTAPIAALSTKRDRAHYRSIAELIASAADALEYAHSMGVVHRDIKPGNLMLDNAGQLWITDFGLAKSLSRDVHDAAITMTGDLIGTLRYMSPEQALAKHGLVDHRTDIYSLGATLYELLTLQPAVQGADKAEILKHIAFEEPTPLRKLDKSIPAELETITLKCLAKEPGERYATAGEVAEDLRRWLGDHAIKAKPPSALHRLAKWAGRHRGILVAVSVSLALVVAIGVGAMYWEMARPRADEARVATERDEKELARKKAVEQAARAEATSQFLEEDLLGQAAIEKQLATKDRVNGRNPNITVRELLDRAADKIETKLADQPYAKASLHITIGKTYCRLGLYEKAQHHLERGVEICTSLLGPTDPHTLAEKNGLASFYLETSQLSKAESLIQEVIRLTATATGVRTETKIISMSNLAMLYKAKGDYEKATKTNEEALKIATAELGADDSRTSTIKDSLAGLYGESGNSNRAVALFRELLESQIAKLGADHPKTLHTKSNLGYQYLHRGEFAKAEALLQEVLREATAKLGPDVLETLCAESTLADLYHLRGENDRAEPLYQEVISRGTTGLGATHWVTLIAKHELGTLYSNRGENAKAESMLQDTLKLQTDTFGPDHPNTLAFKHDLGMHYLGSGDYRKAESLFQELVKVQEGKVAPDNPNLLNTKNSLAGAYIRLGKYDSAEAIYREVLDAQTAKLGPNHSSTLATKHNLGSVYYFRKDYARAESLLLEALQSEVKTLGPEHKSVLNGKKDLAQLYIDWGRYSEAEALLRDLAAFLGIESRPRHRNFRRAVGQARLAPDAGGKVHGS